MKLDDDAFKNLKINYSFITKIIIVIFATIIMFTVFIPVLTTDHYKATLEQQASKYDRNHPDYKKDIVVPSVRLIERTSNCNDLKKMFDENWGWFARPMLADKILKNCYK